MPQTLSSIERQLRCSEFCRPGCEAAYRKIGITAVPFMPDLNEGKGRYREWRLDDDQGRIIFMSKSFARDGENQGANVITTGHNEAKLAGVAAKSKAVDAVCADAADPMGNRRIFEAALSRWGRLDLIVNNAGTGRPLPIDTYDGKAITEICAVNIPGPSLLLKEVLPALRQTKGAVVNNGIVSLSVV